MGIHGLTKLIAEHAPNAIKSNDIKSFFGRKVAIDASMSIYQFMIAVRQQDGQLLQNEDGETTSHLMGMFYRTVRMVDNGIKPVYVFDGKPPTLKSGEVNLKANYYLTMHIFLTLNVVGKTKSKKGRSTEKNGRSQ